MDRIKELIDPTRVFSADYPRVFGILRVSKFRFAYHGAKATRTDYKRPNVYVRDGPRKMDASIYSSLREALTVNYGIVAACAFLFYDIILTLGHEITHVWSARWSFPKAAYLITRYYGMAYLLTTTMVYLSTTNSLETFTVLVIFGGPLVFSALSNLIITLRLHALYNRDCKVLLFLILLIVLQFTIELYTAVRLYLRIVVDTVHPFGLPWPGCIVSSYPTRYVAIGVAPTFITSTVMFLLTLGNLIKSVSHIQGWRSIKRPGHKLWRVPPLLSAFAQDGTVHYFMILIVTIVVAILTLQPSNPLDALLTPWQVTVFSFSTSRLILNLRVSAAHLQGSTATWHQTFSVRIAESMVFQNESPEESVGPSIELPPVNGRYSVLAR